MSHHKLLMSRLQQPLKTSRSCTKIFFLFKASKGYVICQSIFRTEYFLPSARSMRSIQSIFTHICLATLINLCFRDEFFKLSLFLKTGLRLVFEKIKENLLFLRNFSFSSKNKLLIFFWKGIKHPRRIKLSCSSLSPWIWSCDQNRKTETRYMFQCFFEK